MVFLHHLRLGARDEIGVGQLALDLGEFVSRAPAVAGQAGTLGGKVDQVGQRKDESGFVQDDLGGAGGDRVRRGRDGSDAGKAGGGVGPGLRAGGGGSGGVAQQHGGFHGRRHVHLRPHSADGSDETDHPVELGAGVGGTGDRNRRGPGGADQAEGFTITKTIP